MLKRRTMARRTLLILTPGSCKLSMLFLFALAYEWRKDSDIFNEDFYDARP